MAKKAKTAAPKDETKADKFVRLGTARVNKAIKAVSNLANLANRSSYDYTAEHAATMIAAINAAVSHVENRFKSALSDKPEEKADAGFTFAK